MLNIAVLISGRGSNLQALIDATREANFPARIVCVVSNKPDVAGLERASAAGIPALTVNHHDFKDRQAFEQVLDAKLNACGAQLVCLAGFMRLLTPWFVERWHDRLVNIHPSLLPAFPGLDTHKKALEYGVKFAGCTVHFTRAEMDHGPIIAQAAVPVLPDDTETTLAARVLEAEHRIYPLAVRLIAEGRVNIHAERAFIANATAPKESALNPWDEAAQGSLTPPRE